jgi:flagellar motility protein MotE (MotC chaperone)
MKKLLPFLRLGLFCFSLFAVAALAVMLKQKRLWAPDAKTKSADHGEAGHGEEPGDVAKASMPGAEGLGGEGAPGKSGGTNGANGAGAKGSASDETARRELAVATGRTLFDVPQPISIADASNLMNDLKQQRKELDAKRSALDQREKELDVIEKEVEARRADVIAKLGKLEAAAPAATSAGASDAFDADRIRLIGTMLTATAKTNPDAATKLIKALPAERAAVVLLTLDSKDAAAVFPLLKDEELQKITTAMQNVKLPQPVEK